MRSGITLILLCLGLMVGVEDASSTIFSGFLNNSGNSALVTSDLTSPLFGDDFEIANNVALHVISIPEGGTVRFLSKGFAAGGVDPYFSLFQGTGNSATLLDSNYTQAFSTGGDFDLSFNLAPGDYTVALGAFANMSFAENLGTGILGDGFIGLGEPDALGTYYYEVEVSFPGQGAVAVPTVTQWGMIILTTFLGAGAVYPLKRRATG